MDLAMSILHILWNAYSMFCFFFTTFFMYRFLTGIKTALDEVRKDKVIDEVVKTIKLVSIEIVNDRPMMFDAGDHRFICQAATEEALWETAKGLFPDKKLMQKITLDI